MYNYTLEVIISKCGIFPWNFPTLSIDPLSGSTCLTIESHQLGLLNKQHSTNNFTVQFLPPQNANAVYMIRQTYFIFTKLHVLGISGGFPCILSTTPFRGTPLLFLALNILPRHKSLWSCPNEPSPFSELDTAAVWGIVHWLSSWGSFLEPSATCQNE